MSVLRVRGHALPGGERVDLCADGDRWTTEPAPGAELAAEGWLLPGLVDAHTHPGTAELGDPLDVELLRSDLRDHAEAGVTFIRSPGLAGDPPGWFGQEPDQPRAVHAGPWIAQHGQFFPGWGRRAGLDELPALAAGQAAKTGWAKLIGDWSADQDPIPGAVLEAVVAAVHAAGGRVAVHLNYAESCAAAVAARVDSIEHGMWLDPDLLPAMAAQGTALTPTLSVILDSAKRLADMPDSPQKKWFTGGASIHGRLAAQAAEAGVTLLAGTDSRPHGRISGEIRALVEGGVRPHDALAAASWAARSYLGMPGLAEGAPADAVVYDSDPRSDLGQLDHPRAVILRGRLVVRRK